MQNATSCFQNDYVTSGSALKRAAPKQMAFWSRHFWKTNLHFFTFSRGFSGAFFVLTVTGTRLPTMFNHSLQTLWFSTPCRQTQRTATCTQHLESTTHFFFFLSAPVAFRRVALETPEWTSRDSNHHRQAVCQRWQDQRHTNWAIGSPTLYHLVMVWQQKQREKQPHHQAIPEGEWSNKSTMRKGRKWGCQVCLDKGDWTTALPCQLVRAFYAFEVSYSTFSWVERVASKSKPLDGPSVMALLDVQRCLEFQLLGHVEPTCDCQKRKG